MEWIVVTVIIALVGLFMTVGKPIIKLNSNLSTLNANIGYIKKELEEQKMAIKDQRNHAHDSHQKLWEYNDKQDKKINDHETRIKILEKVHES